MTTILILSLIASAAFSYFLWGKGAAEKTALRERLVASENSIGLLNEEIDKKRKYIKNLERFIVDQADGPTVAAMLNRLFSENGDSGEALPLPRAPRKAPD